MTQQSHRMASIVLGINDGLIELTGVMVGLTFALKNHNLVALSGLITGIAAALSMAASAFMQARHEEGKDATRAAITTGIAYFIVVACLVAPFFIFSNLLVSLWLMLVIALVIIAITAWFNSVYLNRKYTHEFLIMLVFSLGVATISFIIGQVLSKLVGMNT